MEAERGRPAFYALAPGGWRDYVTLLHLPYTAWHLSYVAIGAALAPRLDLARLGLVLAAFLLAVGVAAHFLDELRGRPLQTTVPAATLVGGAAVALATAAGIGIYGVAVAGPWIGVLVAVGVIAVPAYNLELLGGRLHGDRWFALLWGSFPVLAGYASQTGTIAPAALAGAAAAYTLSLVQRLLSTRVRHVRRTLDPTERTPELLAGVRAIETALQALTAGVILIALALTLARLYH